MKLLKTGITDLLIVPLTSNAPNGFELLVDSDKTYLNIWGIEDVKLPAGYKYTVLGRASELTEEQCREIVEQVSSWGNIYFRNYAFPNSFSESFTADESFQSLLKSNGILLKNQLHKPTTDNNLIWIDSVLMEQWQEAQSKVSNPLILKAEKV